MICYFKSVLISSSVILWLILRIGRLLSWTDALDDADELSGQGHGKQGTEDPDRGEIAQGQGKHRKIGDQVDPFDGDMKSPAQAHGQGIVAGGRSACADTESYTDANKEGTQERCGQRVMGESGPEPGILLKNAVKDRETSGGDGGPEQKCFAQHPKAEAIAAEIEDESRPGG